MSVETFAGYLSPKFETLLARNSSGGIAVIIFASTDFGFGVSDFAATLGGNAGSVCCRIIFLFCFLRCFFALFVPSLGLEKPWETETTSCRISDFAISLIEVS